MNYLLVIIITHTIKKMLKKLLIKQDINFLEYPLWHQNIRYNPEKKFNWVANGYEYSAKHKVPNKTDALFLFSLLHKVKKNNWDTEIELTRLSLLKDTGLARNKQNYDRIEDSLERWKFVGIRFSGSFYDGKDYQTLSFGIINAWSIDSRTKRLRIRFDKDFILKIKHSNFYKLIDLNELKKLKNPLNIRLYEILLKSFQGRSVWKINAIRLAKKVPMQQTYPSHIIRAIIPAINRIRAKTDLNVHLELDKQERGKIILIFRLEKNVQHSPKSSQVFKKNILTKETEPEELNLVPPEHRSSVKNIISKMCEEKGIEFVTQKIEYVNSMHPTNYAAYLASALRNGFGSEIDLEAKKYEAFKKGGVNCFHKNHGNCGASWDTYKNNKTSDCYWCVRFERSREVTKNKAS